MGDESLFWLLTETVGGASDLAAAVCGLPAVVCYAQSAKAWKKAFGKSLWDEAKLGIALELRKKGAQQSQLAASKMMMSLFSWLGLLMFGPAQSAALLAFSDWEHLLAHWREAVAPGFPFGQALQMAFDPVWGPVYWAALLAAQFAAPCAVFYLAMAGSNARRALSSVDPALEAAFAKAKSEITGKAASEKEKKELDAVLGEAPAAPGPSVQETPPPRRASKRL